MPVNDSSTSNIIPLSSLTSQYGVSDSLKSMFEGLRETPGVNGDKFSHQDINKFAQYIVCRNYGKLCLELSYLLFSVVNYPKGLTENIERKTYVQQSVLLDFFWLEENFTVHRFRQYFKQPYQNTHYKIALSSSNLTLLWANKSSTNFSISPTRTGVLAVLFEFLMMINPALIEQAETNLLAGDESAIKTLSSIFQKELYAFLMDHLTAAQVQRRFRYITQWLNQQGYNEDFLTDECILRFWQNANDENNTDSSLSFKLYSVVFDDLVQLDQAIQQSKQAHEIEHSMVIGNNLEQGEISENVLHNYLFDSMQQEQNYQFLTTEPKFLTQAQWSVLSPCVTYHAYQHNLALSLARLSTFGAWQAILVQAKRYSSAVLEEKLNDLPEQTYLVFQQQLTTLNLSMNNVLSCVYYIYFMHHKTACITEFLSQLSHEQQQHEKQKIRDALSQLTNNEVPNESVIFSIFQDVVTQSPNLQQQLKEAKKAFQKNNKSGFKLLPEAVELPIYNEGELALKHCNELLIKQISRYKSLWENDIATNDNFLSDAFIFKQSFEKMYCVGDSNNE